MIVTSATQTQYTQTTNKTTASGSTSTYDAVSTAQSDQTNSSNNSANVHNSEDHLIKEFLDDMYSKGSVSSASAITKETIQNKVDEYAQALMESRGDAPKSESDISKMLNEYKKELLQDYKKSLDGATNDNMTLEQQAIIKVLLDENTQEAGALEQLLSQTASSTPKATDKMAEMIEKYKDVYTPMPEKFSQEIEDLQTKLIRERYPDYLTLDEFAKKYLVPIEDASPEAQAKAKALQDAKMAESIKTEGPNQYNGGVPYVRDEEREAFIASIMRQHPNNTQDKYFNLSNSPERARAYNAAVYEGLEAGESLDVALKNAAQVRDTYIDNTEMYDEMHNRSKKFFHEYYDEVERRAEEERQNTLRDPLPDQTNKLGKYDGTVLDLREYGFDREITTKSLFKNNAAMVASLQEQIKFFDFILKNEELVKGKYDELDEKYKQRNSFDDTVMTPVKEALPIAQRALAVFSQYKIYDN